MIDTHDADQPLATPDASQPDSGHKEAEAQDAPTRDPQDESSEA